jgi:hypothetical protein
VEVGAIVDTDCASVSIGESASPRNPYSPVFIWTDSVCSAGDAVESIALRLLSRRLGMTYHTCAVRLAQGLAVKFAFEKQIGASCNYNSINFREKDTLFGERFSVDAAGRSGL